MSALRDEVSMKVAFSNGMINKLCKSFFYSHGKEQPCIQVGKALEDFAFGLHIMMRRLQNVLVGY